MRISSLLLLAMAFSLSVVTVYGSNRVLPTAVTQDDTWTVIEYPEGREVIVELKPGMAMAEAKATAHVTRTGNDTAINLEVTGAIGAETTHQVYVVDSLGNATLLGTLNITDGAGTLNSKTALSKFMIVVSPEADLTAIGSETKISLRSVVPDGFAVVPRESQPDPARNATSEEPAVEPNASNVEMPSAEPASPEYEVPMLAVGSLKRDSNRKLRAKFANGFTGVKATVVINAQKNGQAEVRLRFTDLRELPEGTHYVVWQVGPDKSYNALGHLTQTSKKREFTLDAQSSSPDFGLLITFENSDATIPAGSMVATIIR